MIQKKGKLRVRGKNKEDLLKYEMWDTAAEDVRNVLEGGKLQ